jgi:hypothetical protein
MRDGAPVFIHHASVQNDPLADRIARDRVIAQQVVVHGPDCIWSKGGAGQFTFGLIQHHQRLAWRARDA